MGICPIINADAVCQNLKAFKQVVMYYLKQLIFKPLNVIDMNFKCFLLGHKPLEVTDSGFAICERCNAHEYYDFWSYKKSGFIYKPKQFMTFLLWKIKFSRLGTWFRWTIYPHGLYSRLAEKYGWPYDDLPF